MVEINWLPDRQSDIPIYKQIIHYIKNKIEEGHWPVGSRIPPQRELARAFSVNRTTVVEALDELKADGLLESEGRRGTKIVNNTWSLLASSLPPNWENYIKKAIHKPNHPTIQTINKLEFESHIVRLGTGELSPELFPKEMIRKVMNKVAFNLKSLGYEEPKGLLHLRKILSSHLKKIGIKASPASILIVSGALQALHLIAIGLLPPGSKVLVEKPSYIKSIHVFQSAGMRLKGVDLDSKGLKPEGIVKRNKPKQTTLLYTIPTFHNPTGILLSESRRARILEVCERERIPIIEDDIYRDVWIDKKPPRPLKSKDQNGTILYLGSISKSLSPGLRIGWLVGPEPVIERLADIKMQTDYGSSSLSQWVVAELLQNNMYKEYLRDLRKELKVRRDITIKTLEKYTKDIAEWKKPCGGFYIWVKIKKKISMEKLFKQALKEGILINPGSLYDFDSNQCIRISYSYASKENLKWGIKRLSDLIKHNC